MVPIHGLLGMGLLLSSTPPVSSLPPMEKLSSKKPVPGAKKVGDHCPTRLVPQHKEKKTSQPGPEACDYHFRKGILPAHLLPSLHYYSSLLSQDQVLSGILYVCQN